ncbi:hypothetical protein [Arenimonas oryziterrae]|uniref:Uncharacterized protein n=1 Tax=Arenimonas oryziterrae DSM 21050 = YC6267 TaxID=1121015 RepID=A0A091AWD1_9GAMM|nr:hypothetical protein [Arenimonas oryziterrae]KFN44608.1 hypothetical protein N789_00955 [Arenimonas oryziterrae DSM 21050 = YC6267]
MSPAHPGTSDPGKDSDPALRAQILREAQALPVWSVPSAGTAPALPPIEPGRRTYARRDFENSFGEDFVERLYRAVVKRAPRTEELHDALTRLERGENPILLMGQVAASPEARAGGVRIKGLDRRYALERIYRIPLLGGLIERVSILLRLPSIQREQNVQQSRLQARCEAAEAQAAEQVARLYEEIGELRKTIARQGAAPDPSAAWPGEPR